MYQTHTQNHWAVNLFVSSKRKSISLVHPQTWIKKLISIQDKDFFWNIFRKLTSPRQERRTEEETWPRLDMRFKTFWQKIYVSFSLDKEESSDANLTPFYRMLQLLHALLNTNSFYVIGSSLTFSFTTLHNFFLWFMDCKWN